MNANAKKTEPPPAENAELTLEALFKELSSSPEGLTRAEAGIRLAKYGPNALEEKTESAWLKFLGYFWGPIPWMIEVAAVLSALVSHWVDLTIILVLLAFNAVVGFWQEHQAANAVDALKRQLALKARVKRDAQWTEIDAAQLVPGDIVRLRLGDIIPADVRLIEGDYLSVDQSALTGESLPVDKKIGDVAYSSSVAKQGEMVALVTATGANTYFGKTARLVSTAKSVSHFQKAVLSIGNYLIYLSLGLAAILLLTMFARGEPVLTLVQFALILVVAAIPVAMPAVLSVTMAIGAVVLARKKAILTRLEAIEEMAGMDILCSDKTGTLTQNQLTLGEPAPFGAKTAQELILAGALASKAEDRDAIDLAVLNGLKDPATLNAFKQAKFVPFDPIRKRTEAEVHGPDGQPFKVTKGAPQVVLELCHPPENIAQAVDAKVNEFAGKGFRTLGVARQDGTGAWQFLGLLPLFDPPREDSAETIRDANEHGIQVKMVTGDNVAIARQIAGQLGLGANIHTAGEFFKDASEDDVILPKAAAAALVLTAPGLSVIIQAVETARTIFERMNSYAIYRITETIRIMFFVVAAMLVFKFYPITTVMIILLALLNDLPILTIAYDNTWLDPKPVRWNMQRVLTIATVLGLIGVVETFLILVIAREWFHLTAAEIQSFIYLKLAVAGHLTLFVARTRKPFLSKPHPAPILLAAILGTQTLAALIVGFGWLVTPIAWKYVGFVWIYCLVWVVIEDWAKLHVYRHLELSSKHHRKFLERVKAPLQTHVP